MRSLLLLLSVLLLSSCGMRKEMREMHDATIDVKKTSEEMHSDLKENESSRARRESFHALLKEAESPGLKLVYAAHYIRSFDFQMWSGLGRDTNDMRYMMAQKNLEEFMLSLQEFLPPGLYDPRPLANWKLNPFWGNNIASFNAIASALQEIDPKQQRMINGNSGFKELAMNSMLEEALRASFERKLGQSIDHYPLYVREILRHERLAQMVIQTRMNYSVVLALGKTTPIAENMGFLKMRLGRWQLDLSGYELDEIKLATEKMNIAIATYDFLRSVGIEPKMNAPLASLMSRMTPADSLRANYRQYQLMIKQKNLAPELKNSRAYVEVDFARTYVDFMKLNNIKLQ